MTHAEQPIKPGAIRDRLEAIRTPAHDGCPFGPCKGSICRPLSALVRRVREWIGRIV